MANRDALKEELIQTDEDFRQLHEQHQGYEEQLEALYHKSLLSQDDEVEMKRIKRSKLLLKDRMEEMLRAREAAGVSA